MAMRDTQGRTMVNLVRLMSVAEDGKCEPCLPPQHCWRSRPGIEHTILSLAAQRAANQTSELSAHIYGCL